MSKHLFTVEQAAEHLDLHVKTVRRFIHEGKVKAKRIGKEFRITRADLEEFGGAAPKNDAPVARTRSVLASTIVDIDAISPKDSDRITTFVMASLNSRRGHGDSPRVDTIYFPERGQLRVTITGTPAFNCELMRTVDALLAGA
jgi:excisionase family DNA binding protein